MTESRYLNRESSWIEFNSRVLEEALDPSLPLLYPQDVYSVAGPLNIPDLIGVWT